MSAAPVSIRARLTFWYALTIALVLALFAFGTFAYVRESLFAQIDVRLDENLALIARAAANDMNDLAEIEHHTRVPAFRVLEGDWPLYVSGGWIAADLDKAGLAPRQGRWIYAPARGGIYHLKEHILNLGSRSLRIDTAEQSEQIHRGLDKLQLTLLVAFPTTLVLSLFGAYFLAGRLLIPLQHITQRARTISADNLSQRLLISNAQDELGQLSTVLNEAFARIDDAFDRLKRFTQDAAHELRTPLAVLRGVGEVGLQKARDGAAYREVIASMLEEVDRLGRLIDGLLMLARAESGHFSIAKQPADLSALCQEVVHCLLVLAEEKKQKLTFCAQTSFLAYVDRDTLRLALMNLIANAIRFTADAGSIRVSLGTNSAEAIIAIQDNGPGIAAEHHAHIFERFYRVDASRTHSSGGTGLGLAIAHWAVTSNGGRIELDSEPGQGSEFRIIFPVRS